MTEPIIDGLIHDFPKDPYFRELKGQMLFENGRIADSVQPYEEAVRGRLQLGWKAEDASRPAFVGRRELVDFPLG